VVLSTADRSHLLVFHMPSVHCLSSLGNSCVFSVFCEHGPLSDTGAGGMLRCLSLVKLGATDDNRGTSVCNACMQVV